MTTTTDAASRFTAAKLLRSYRGLIAIAVLAFVLLVWAPGALSAFRLGNLAKYCCWAIAAVGIGLAWGRGGMLVMGQGVFFGLGAYVMAMHLKLSDAGPGKAPDFMVLYGNGEVPVWWEPFRSGALTLVAIVALPAAVAAVLGMAIFRRRVKGAYFAILSQALAAAFAIFLIGQQTTTYSIRRTRAMERASSGDSMKNRRTSRIATMLR